MRCKTRLTKKAEQKLDGDIEDMEKIGAKPLESDDSDIDEDEMAACVAGEADDEIKNEENVDEKMETDEIGATVEAVKRKIEDVKVDPKKRKTSKK